MEIVISLYRSPSQKMKEFETFVKNLHSSVHPNFHHQTVIAKFDLKVNYPLPYDRCTCSDPKCTFIFQPGTTIF